MIGVMFKSWAPGKAVRSALVLESTQVSSVAESHSEAPEEDLSHLLYIVYHTFLKKSNYFLVLFRYRGESGEECAISRVLATGFIMQRSQRLWYFSSYEGRCLLLCTHLLLLPTPTDEYYFLIFSIFIIPEICDEVKL